MWQTALLIRDWNVDDEEEIPRKTQRSESQKSLLSNELPPDGRGTSLKDRMPRPLLQNRGARNLQASDVASNTSVDSEEQDWTPLGPSSDTYSKIRMEIRSMSLFIRRHLHCTPVLKNRQASKILLALMAELSVYRSMLKCG